MITPENIHIISKNPRQEIVAVSLKNPGEENQESLQKEMHNYWVQCLVYQVK